ncbi:hypothetical protein SGFS_048540 [Streptomyces graminofaciens]|uniref:HTH arsR-type domain-containing protein n=1 Tax=Streptomyces graminofaciens TaxID=68212 RepID=A0ABM7FC04_9ACTN|nr:helix-turn-helix domain-containing protein [Streptomyces graminofaciens]BBC33560.1 hypothetical protein SGFS_048540 [Streptomyces graminofaciens]
MPEPQPKPERVPEPLSVRSLDTRSLRGLAHPLRMRLLGALRQGGPATASQLAEKLGESSGATSYHLRQLAAYGFVEDDPERGKGRERWWKAAHEGTRIDVDLYKDPNPEVRGAVDILVHSIANNHTQELSTWLGTMREWPVEWVTHSDLSDFTLRLTPALAGELTEKVHALIEEYRTRATADDPEAEQVRVHTHTFPIRTD